MLTHGVHLEPLEHISLARLAFLPSLLRTAPPILCALLAADEGDDVRTWKGALVKDLAWLARHTQLQPELLPHQLLANAEDEARTDPRRWRAKLRSAAQAARLARRNGAEAQAGLTAIRAAITRAGLLNAEVDQEQERQPPQLQPTPPVRPCPECGRLFPRQALVCHRMKVHGVRAPARRMVAGTACPVCLTEFHTRTRLIRHLEHDCPRCSLQLAQRPWELTQEEALELDRLEQARRRSRGSCDVAARLPAYRICGPRTAPVVAVPLEAALGPPAPAQVEQQQQEQARAGQLQHDPAGLDEPEADCPIDQEADVLEPACVQLESSRVARAQAEAEHQAQAEERQSQRQQLSSAVLSKVRLLAGAPALVVHLCSGRRRMGDVQYFLDHWSRRFEARGRELRVLSIDVAVDKRRGNLADPVALGRWIELAQAGLVVGMLGGPPCETWSQARGQGEGPPALRTAELPWGRQGLSPKQLEQVRVSTILLHGFLVIFATLVGSGGFAILEHPAMPREGQQCSIWRLPEVRTLMSHPDVELVTFRQGPLGQVAVKPTTLLALRVPSIRTHLAHQADLDWRPPEMAAIGKDATGRWRTTRLKEYPPGMCVALAAAIADAVQEADDSRTATAEERARLDALLDLDVPFHEAVEGAETGADFAREAAVALPRSPIPWSHLAAAALGRSSSSAEVDMDV